MQKIDKLKIKKIMVLGCIGIGNLLLFSPALKILRRKFSSAKIVMVVLKESFTALYESEPDIDDIVVLDASKNKSLRDKIRALSKIRKIRPDLTVTTFPSNRFEYNIVPFITGAKIRVAHKYKQKRYRTLSFLQNYRIKVDESLHDLEQNLNLVKPLGLDTNNIEKKIYMNISLNDEKFADNFLKNLELNDKKLIGIHPGSSSERGMDYKRWPVEYYARLCDRLAENYGYITLIFGSHDENSLKRKIQQLMKNESVIIEQLPLKKTAALISRCDKFVTNDSGLMHIAVAADVHVYALFGPSDPGRTAPYGDKHKVIRLGMNCSPCWSIKNLGVGNVNCIYNENLCMKNLSVDFVYKNITG